MKIILNNFTVIELEPKNVLAIIYKSTNEAHEFDTTTTGMIGESHYFTKEQLENHDWMQYPELNPELNPNLTKPKIPESNP